MNERPVQTRREEYADATRAALLDAAKEVFVEEGFQQAAVETIARRARVTRGALYHHFEDKKALFEALVIALQADAASRLVPKAQGTADPLSRVISGTRAFLAICTEPAYRRLVIQEAPAVLGSKRCRAIEEEYTYGLLIQALKGLKASGVIGIDNAELAARLIGAMVCETALLLEDAKQPRVLERQAMDIVERVFAAIRK